MTQDPFKDGHIISISTAEVVAWTQANAASRLFLPPIQRSVVWKNQQIVNYWDSLLRGYPAGLMMVHRPNQNVARTTEGQTCEIQPEDFELFDGQQRLTAILLGHQAGQLKNRIRLWVDLGMDPSTDSGLLFQLRVSSTGQPFGYQPKWPNAKFDLKKRRHKVTDWLMQNNLTRFDPPGAFEKVAGNDLIDSETSVPLQLYEVISLFAKGEKEATDGLMRHWPNLKSSKIEDFVHALDRALKLQIPFQLIDSKVVKESQEYVRFFGRLGQGGTPLNDDELTYSIIKHQYPQVHDCIKNVNDGTTGRVASEVNLVLASVRVAKVLAPWEGAKEWEILGRPFPGFISRLKALPEVEAKFKEIICVKRGEKLQALLEDIRDRLVYDKTRNPGGLPAMLLARLPHQLVDVLLLMATQRQQRESKSVSPDPLPPFVLHWLLFVKDHDKAAHLVFRRFREEGRIAGQNEIQALIRDFEADEIAWPMPHAKRLPQLRAEIEKGNHYLRPGPERFAGLDTDDEHKCGDALRILASNPELIKRTLMWLQRDYLTGEFGYFNPTSSRDEDLPIDLDHLIPDSIFGFNWNSASMRPDFADPEENFYWQRKPIGNSLGNFHWLDAQKNRSRGDGALVVAPGDLIHDPSPWDHLIKTSPWNANDVANFQKLIDLRTITIYEHLWITGGLNVIVTEPNKN